VRLIYWFYRAALATGRWGRRRFTPAGRLVLGGTLLAASLGSNPEQTPAYQALVLLVTLLGVALGFAPFFRTRIRLERRLPRFATVGEPLRYRVTLHNPGDHPQGGLEYLEAFRSGGLDFPTFRDRLRPGRRMRSLRLSEPLPPLDPASARPAPIPTIPRRGSVEVAAEIIPLRRGPLQFAGPWLARSDPLGLVRGLHHLPNPGTVMVLPRRYPVPLLGLPGSTRYQQGGVALASGVGESEEFAGVREYRRGDSPRRIHWRATARMGRPVVREHQDEFFVRHALVLDTFCDPSVDRLFEEAVGVAASFACTVPDQESLLDLLFVGLRPVCVTAGRGVGHVEEMLETLACARPCREPRWKELHELVVSHSDRISGCLMVLLEWDEARRELVRRLKALRVPVWVMVVVAPGEPPAPGPPASGAPDRLVILESGRIGEQLKQL
jgi:uncharacterized protein (DUF58 family)